MAMIPMIQENSTYFKTAGPDNTVPTLKLAVEHARKCGINKIVIASTNGMTAELMANEIEHEGISITIVTYAFGQKEPGTNPMPVELREGLKEKGFNICTAAHALSGVERSLSTTFGGIYPAEIIANTLRMFGQGMKVCVEISAMAADAGFVTSEERIIAIGGTAKGADTAIVLRPEVSSKILKTRIDKVICKPIG